LQVLLADDPQSFLNQAAALDRLAAGQAAALREGATAKLRFVQAEARLTERTAAQDQLVDELEQRKKDIEAAVSEKEDYLAQLKEEERQRLAALQAAEAAASSAAASAAISVAANVPASGRAAIAVQAALAQVGEPYTYNAVPPNTWDCSKLTAWAWGQAGVSLVAYSFTQAAQTQRISTSQLQPGDLLFYFNGAHHVAMYIGGGQIVEASSPSTGVRVTSMWNSWTSAHFSYAGRPIG
jgi:peptidoglycan DL-endopeptidase CwlO